VISLLALILATGSAYLSAHPAVSVALVGVPVLSVARSLVMAIRSQKEN
jgi:hypothetical protein